MAFHNSSALKIAGISSIINLGHAGTTTGARGKKLEIAIKLVSRSRWIVARGAAAAGTERKLKVEHQL